MRLLCREAGLPDPEPEYDFARPRKFRMDFAWPGLLVALEIEGATWVGGRHTHGSGFAKDVEKYNLAAQLGYRLFRITTTQIRQGGLSGVLRQMAQLVAKDGIGATMTVEVCK